MVRFLQGAVLASPVFLVEVRLMSMFIVVIVGVALGASGLAQGLWWRRRLLHNTILLDGDWLEIREGGTLILSVNRSAVRTARVVGTFTLFSLLTNQGADDFPRLRIVSSSVLYSPPVLWWGSDAAEAQRTLDHWLGAQPSGG